MQITEIGIIETEKISEDVPIFEYSVVSSLSEAIVQKL